MLPPFECIALLLQGGGALGAYQAGVYEALAEADLHPDWIAGISIGAINGALIAGNAPEARVDKLRAFWERAPTLKRMRLALMRSKSISCSRVALRQPVSYALVASMVPGGYSQGDQSTSNG